MSWWLVCVFRGAPTTSPPCHCHRLCIMKTSLLGALLLSYDLAWHVSCFLHFLSSIWRYVHVEILRNLGIGQVKQLKFSLSQGLSSLSIQFWVTEFLLIFIRIAPGTKHSPYNFSFLLTRVIESYRCPGSASSRSEDSWPISYVYCVLHTVLTWLGMSHIQNLLFKKIR